MTLKDIRDYIESLEFAPYVYSGTLADKEEKSIGVYNSKHQSPYNTAIGGTKLQSYEVKRITILVHWNKSPIETEKAAYKLFGILETTNEVETNGKRIKFIQPLYEPQPMGPNEKGIHEYVLEMAFVCEKECYHEE